MSNDIEWHKVTVYSAENDDGLVRWSTEAMTSAPKYGCVYGNDRETVASRALYADRDDDRLLVSCRSEVFYERDCFNWPSLNRAIDMTNGDYRLWRWLVTGEF